jgi:hypothetical protein
LFVQILIKAIIDGKGEQSIVQENRNTMRFGRLLSFLFYWERVVRKPINTISRERPL